MRTRYQITEKQILEAAITELKKISGVSINHLRSQDHELDAFLEIKLRQIRKEFFVEIRGEVREHNAEHIIDQFGSEKDKWLLVARYIPGPLKEYLKKHGCNYLEMTGNCYISTNQLFIYNNDREVKHVLRTPEGKLWKTAGLKFLFVILQDPMMLTKPQRAIATAAGIASGNISTFLQELREDGYLIKDQQGETLQREKLIDRWVEAFYISLRPKLQKGTFRFIRPEQQKTWRDLELPGLYWGGEPGADLYTNYLSPENFIVYTSIPTTSLLIRLNIVPDDNGNITILDKFWQNSHEGKTGSLAAPQLLVYADLKYSLDSRNWEAAQKVKKMILNAN